ncbi:biopolymer transporter ExbD [Aliikangiella marina]|uniref:Biopolymer transporter ExbD n=1 Tax=Aliikangiella marina TaxID=1712262 RepID=A0A545TI95_9GAMM|nr:biopolymer transporter ExbD [Aliikangiella marina]TQV76942.1 biopolymer transporter ExbD [Aliikangiella marina]
MIKTSLNTSHLEQSNLNFSSVKKPAFATKLNLVALMDIFTILVFFLLLNSGDANQLENAKFVKLPDSSAKSAPHVEASIIIGEDEIWLNNESIILIEEVAQSKEKIIGPLAEALQAYTEKKETFTSYEKANGLAVTIMGDKSVSYSLLERVMATCSAENFRDISLAVNRIASSSILVAQPNGSGTEQSANVQGGAK